jgi:hypothetical protein
MRALDPVLTHFSVVAAWIAALLCGAASAAPLPFTADYSASYNGMAVTATRQLERDSDGYREQLQLRSLLGSVTEQSLFTLQDDWPQPQSSVYSLSLLGLNREERQQFDWSTLSVDYRRGDKQRTLAIKPNCLDITTHRLALVADLRGGRKPLEYCVINRGKLKQYRYQALGEQRIDTPLGPLNTLHVERLREADETRSTELWLAIDWDLLLVRLHQFEDDEEYRLDLSSASIDGQKVAGVPAQLAATPSHNDPTGN